MKTRFIFNPHSGRNRQRPGFAQSLKDFVAARGIEADVVVTEFPGHATALAREAALAGAVTVAAVGGDGTMNEVAQGLLDTPAALALVPCGSGNGLALHLGVPRAFGEALRLATGEGGRVATIDTGLAAGLPFFNAMGLGLDAEVSDRFNRLSRRGLSGYCRVAWRMLRVLPMQRCTVVVNGGRETLDVVLLTVANSDQYGNHARIAPGARVDDGALDLVAVQPVSRVGLLMLAVRLFAGSIDRSPHVRRWHGSRFQIHRAPPGLIHTDGETHAVAAAFAVAVRPHSLRVVVPEHSRAVSTRPPPAHFALQLP